MDPYRNQGRHGDYWLPRTRGDGPCRLSGIAKICRAPPHTRGWTPYPDVCAKLAAGSPAHAGMDPRVAFRHPAITRLPRTRGDGPDPNSAAFVYEQAPPHTRGWTHFALKDWVGFLGSPAHAGMDLDPRIAPRWPQRLPRTRGDGPFYRFATTSRYWAPPHTRGWTQIHNPLKLWRKGSPAHAGMDLWCPPAPPSRYGLPRTRGDGPVILHTRAIDGSAPPHTRGWALYSSPLTFYDPGSPAHAGMDPRLAARAGQRRWLPRTRGDGPRGLLHMAIFDDGSPAHAGMDLSHQEARAEVARLPRTRGDGPAVNIRLGAPCTAPPHTRGWTRLAAPGPELTQGSPAHAGMDPLLRVGHAMRKRLPRTRGDGP